jgi:nucleotide-binding universal stress UspA family protein
LSGIVCAIRGGPASRKTIDEALKLAVETSQSLYFLYVVNLAFLSHTASSRVRTISKELRQMGDFIILAAQERAHAQGVDAQGFIRQGNVEKEIISVCNEVGANYLVLGKPLGQDEEDTFTHERILEFIQRIEAESGAQVIVVEGGESD